MAKSQPRTIVVAVVAVLLLLTATFEVFTTAFPLLNNQATAKRQCKSRNVVFIPSVRTMIKRRKRSNTMLSTSTTTALSLAVDDNLQDKYDYEGDGSIHQDHTRHDVLYSRRSFWRLSSTRSLTILAAAAAATTQMSSIAPALAKDSDKEWILPSRLDSGDLTPPMYGMDGSDVYYPSWLTGTWKVVSITTDVQAPCGMAFFGGNETYRLARADMGPDHALVYEARFLPTSINSNNNYNNNNDSSELPSSSACVADREHNVKSIAKVALGPNSIVDVSLATPNHFTCLVLSPSPPSPPSPSSTTTMNNKNKNNKCNNNNNIQDATATTTTTTTTAPSSRLLNVDLLILQRRQEFLEDGRFACSEVVREIVTPAPTATTSTNNQLSLQQQQQQSTSTLFREVETISLYTPVVVDNNDDDATNDSSDNTMISTVHCLQRSASFLVPRRDDPRSIALWQVTQGRPVDVRCYNVTYSDDECEQF